MRLYHIVNFFLVFVPFFSIYSNIITCHKREKRFLRFPPKSNVVLTMSLLKLFPSESIANTLTELDVLFPLPLKPFEEGLHPRQKRELERNVILSKLKEVGGFFRMNGDACLRTFICEVNKSIPQSSIHEDNLLRDIVDIIFMSNITNPEGCYDREQTSCYFI